MPKCLFASDLHGRPDRYEKLLEAINDRNPRAVFLGGDLFPFPPIAVLKDSPLPADFGRDYLGARFRDLRSRMGAGYPDVFLILGNDDPRSIEPAIKEGDQDGIWIYCQERWCDMDDYDVFGYSYVPPTPFQLKDWERYDVSRYVPPGCVAPEDGSHSVDVDEWEIRYTTIADDLARLAAPRSLDRSVLLFHSPPFETALDRLDNGGKSVDHVPLDTHVGSIAVRRFIATRQPLLTLHGHIHESARMTGKWRDLIGRTHCFSAAHDGPELALVEFDPADPGAARRDLL